ncbi:MAG: hypothetical protein ABSG28_11465 [Methanoregula sp.]|uniref:hypothetical protein n=1 Tax=Methanoregula sp. TaxID=2052170 RepID=UPI003C1FD284
MTSLIQKIKLKCDNTKENIVSIIAAYRKPKRESGYSREELRRMMDETKGFFISLHDEIGSMIGRIRNEKPFTDEAKKILKTEIEIYIANLKGEAIFLSDRNGTEVVTRSDVYMATESLARHTKNSRSDSAKLFGGIFIGAALGGCYVWLSTFTILVAGVTLLFGVIGALLAGYGFWR